MAPARPLRDVFTELTGTPAGSAAGADPERLLAAAGHPDLPAGLVTEAVVSYADTAPAEVAEHLAPFVMAHGPVPPDPDGPAAAEPAGWLDVLASVPDVLDRDQADADQADADQVDADQVDADTGGLDVDAPSPPAPHEDAGDGPPGHDPFPLDFGTGADDHEPTAGRHDPAGPDAYAQPRLDAPALQHFGPTTRDDPAALDGLAGADSLDGLDGLDGPEPDDLAGADGAATEPDTVDGDPLGGA